MRELGNSGARPGKTWSVVSIAAALLGAAVLCQPELAQAAPHGGGGGFHGGFGAFPRRWISRRRVPRGRVPWYFRGPAQRLCRRAPKVLASWLAQRTVRLVVGPGLAWTYYDYPWWGSYPDYDYYDYSQPYASQTWYYCSDPAGYYPYVTQCNTGWQAVPAS